MFSILLFSLLTGHSLQCYTCKELTPVQECLKIENCTEAETICKTTIYSLEDGKDNSFFIHTFNRNQCFDSAVVETSSSFHLKSGEELLWEPQLSACCGKQCLCEGIFAECRLLVNVQK